MTHSEMFTFISWNMFDLSQSQERVKHVVTVYNMMFVENYFSRKFFNTKSTF